MAKIRRDIKTRPLLNRIANANEIATASTGNANASGLTTQLSALAAATTTLSTKISAAQATQDAAMAAITAQNTAAEAWNTAFDTLADAAHTLTGGDPAKIESLGLSPYTPGSAPPIGLPTQVLNLVVTTGDFEGTVDPSWDKVTGAKSYEVQVTTTPNDSASWRHAVTSTKSSCTITGLTSGVKYWFRVAAIGSAGQGPWSDPATKMAG